MPGIKITDDDRKNIDVKRFICCVCDLLLHYPMQTICGHLICQSCVEEVLKSSNPKCPEDGEELSKEKIFQDAYTRRELKNIRIHCSNPGCSWFSIYDQHEDHSKNCKHALIKCTHSQCQMRIQRSYLEEHLKRECQYRNVKCDYCSTEVSLTSIKEHVDTTCESVLVRCKYCKQDIVRKDIEHHKRLSCDEVPVNCEFQAIGCNHNKILKRKELRQHSNDGLTYHVRLLLQYILAFASQLANFIPRPEFTEIVGKIRDDITKVRSGLAERFVMFVGKLTGLEKRIESMESTGAGNARSRSDMEELKAKVGHLGSECNTLRERNVSLEREIRDKISTTDRLRRRMDQIDESLALNTVKITDLEFQRDPRAQQKIHCYNGTLLWKIEGYQTKRQDAITGVKTALYSPPFYSAQYGYKMCAKLYLNGDGFGKGSHLSLFFVVMKGDYDALQTWPFRKKITMMLMDQGNGDHMIDSFNSDPQSSSFQRPKSDMNIASGSPLFMPHDSLNNRQFIKDDVLFIKILVG